MRLIGAVDVNQEINILQILALHVLSFSEYNIIFLGIRSDFQNHFTCLTSLTALIWNTKFDQMIKLLKKERIQSR